MRACHNCCTRGRNHINCTRGINGRGAMSSAGKLSRKSLAGRPEANSHAEIEQVAFRLFAEHGFDGTTLSAIAEGVGVGRRTLLRYYASKHDIPWGQDRQSTRLQSRQ